MSPDKPQSGPPSPEIQIRRITAGDLPTVASLHRDIFPDYFLTHMGQDFVERFYREFVDRPGNHGLVAACQDRLVGIAVGTTSADTFYNQFYSRNLVAAAYTFLKRFLQDPYIRQNFLARMTHFRRAFRSVIRRLRGPTSVGIPSTVPLPARLLSIGVERGFRGQGVAGALVDRFCQQLEQDRVGAVGLSVRADNSRAIAFYDKTGWQRVKATGTLVQYFRSTHPNHPVGAAPRGCPPEE